MTHESEQAGSERNGRRKERIVRHVKKHSRGHKRIEDDVGRKVLLVPVNENTRWSQGSLASTDTTLTDYYRSDFHKQQETLTAVPPPPPPMPPMPSTAPLNVRGGRPRDTTFTRATDDFADYYRESTMVMPEPQPELPRVSCYRVLHVL